MKMKRWIFFAALLVAAPFVFRSGLALSLLSQMGYVAIICLSYNLLFGQGGMLSFGHAVYVGTGAFAAAHVVNAASAAGWWLPLPVVPLVGGVAGAGVAFVLGFVTTRKAGTAFAMITLGIGELVGAMSNTLPGLFGGEGGISINRVYGGGWMGLTFGPQEQVYGLIAVYCFVCTAVLYAFTGTPLGRLLNAVRDNPERVEFIGYSAQRVRWHAFTIAGFFAGIGGALATINFEIVTSGEAFSAIRSGGYLLFTFLGGASLFAGPLVGAVLLVMATMLLSEWTQAWLLYLGLGFCLLVMYAPGGVAGLWMNNWALLKAGLGARLWRGYLTLFLSGAALAAGVIGLVETVYRWRLQFDYVPSLWPMLALLALALIGGFAWVFAWRRFHPRWLEAQVIVAGASA